MGMKTTYPHHILPLHLPLRHRPQGRVRGRPGVEEWRVGPVGTSSPWRFYPAISSCSSEGTLVSRISLACRKSTEKFRHMLSLPDAWKALLGKQVRCVAYAILRCRGGKCRQNRYFKWAVVDCSCILITFLNLAVFSRVCQRNILLMSTRGEYRGGSWINFIARHSVSRQCASEKYWVDHWLEW